MSIPTDQQLIDSENYAISKMCIMIPSQFKQSMTKWDDTAKVCRITKEGCAATPTNPLSRPVFTNNGTPIDLLSTEKNKNILNFWNDGFNWQPDQYVYKNVSGSTGQVCARANSLLYQWCEYPRTRTSGKGYDDVPPFKYTVRDGVETCIIGKDYCNNRGVDYDGTIGNERCYVSTGQQIAEFLASSVLVRYAKQS